MNTPDYDPDNAPPPVEYKADTVCYRTQNGPFLQEHTIHIDNASPDELLSAAIELQKGTLKQGFEELADYEEEKLARYRKKHRNDQFWCMGGVAGAAFAADYAAHHIRTDNGKTTLQDHAAALGGWGVAFACAAVILLTRLKATAEMCRRQEPKARDTRAWADEQKQILQTRISNRLLQLEP